MAVPTGVVWECKPHTAAKHRILEKYLQAWYPIMMQAAKVTSVTYAEGFAGAGVYKNGEAGSPVKAARVFLARPHFLQAKTLRMVLVEADGKRLGRLKQEMASALGEGRHARGLQVHYAEGKCAATLLPAMSTAGAPDGPVFAFLDGFGGPDVPLALARSIAARRSGEVLVTFGTSFLTRFGTKEIHQAAGDEAFGGTEWRRVHQLPAGEKKAFLVTAYRDSLKKAGFSHVVSFEMIDDTGSDLHLVFGTSSIRGVEKMKDAMWGVDPVSGVRYRDPRDPDQLELDIVLNPHVEPLTRALLSELASGERTVAQLRDHALLETVYRAPHATTALKSMLSAGLIDRSPAFGQLAGTTRIRITPAGRERLAAPELTLFLPGSGTG